MENNMGDSEFQFQVGDIVTGNKYNRYGYTDRDAIMEVTELNVHSTFESTSITDTKYMRVKVLSKKGIPEDEVFSDREFVVNPKYFKLVSECVKVTDDMIADNNEVDSLFG